MSRLRTRRNSKDSKTQKLTGLRKLEEKETIRFAGDIL
jgi:hypothetical protein